MFEKGEVDAPSASKGRSILALTSARWGMPRPMECGMVAPTLAIRCTTQPPAHPRGQRATRLANSRNPRAAPQSAYLLGSRSSPTTRFWNRFSMNWSEKCASTYSSTGFAGGIPRSLCALR